MLEDQGVLLTSWRAGGDVMDDAIRLVERAKRKEEAGGVELCRWRSREIRGR